MVEVGSARGTLELDVREGGPIPVTWAAATHNGLKRPYNEDSWVAQELIFAVADGMGGHDSGDLASAAVVTALSEAIHGVQSDETGITGALQQATEQIASVSKDSESGVGTTVTGVTVIEQDGERYWFVFNIGDSRTYLWHDDQLRQVTVDHSVVQELLEQGVIAPEDAENHPVSNLITRAVGFENDPMPDFWLLPIVPDSRLVICSDGITKELRDEEIAELLRQSTAPHEAVESIIDAALESGGRDNSTLVIVETAASE